MLFGAGSEFAPSVAMRLESPTVASPSPRERCMVHGIFVREDGACSRCVAREDEARSGSLLRAMMGIVALVVIAAIGVRVVAAVGEAKAARDERKKAALAARIAEGGPRVVVYTMAGCGACKAEKAFMAARAVPYLERPIDTDPSARRELQALGKHVLPTTVVDDEVFVGFSAPGLEGALRKHGVL